MFNAAAGLVWQYLLPDSDDASDDDDDMELQAAVAAACIDPHAVVPRANFYHWYDHRSTLESLMKRFPDEWGNTWRSQFRFDPT